MAVTNKKGRVHITPLDAHPRDFNRDTMLEWLASTRWIENKTKQMLGDVPYAEDYIQEIWVQIIEKADRLVDIFLYEGKGKFINFIKMIIQNNCRSVNSPAYRNNKRQYEKIEVHLDELGWNILDETYEGGIYDFKEIRVENPND